MVDSSKFEVRPYTLDSQIRRSMISWWMMYLGLLGLSGLINLLMLRGGPNPAMIAGAVYLSGAALIFYRPRYGVYLVLGLTMISDISLVPWYPFTKNFSSTESITYINDALIVNPLEVYLIMTIVAWVGNMAMVRKWTIRTGILTWPAVLFGAFAAYGLIHGLLGHGDSVIAFWEARPMFYLVVMLILGSNLIETRAHVSRIFWIIAIAFFIKSLFGLAYLAYELRWDTSEVEAIAEHSLSVNFNLLFVLVITAWAFRDSYTKRLVLPLLLPTTLFVYFANQRRAGYMSLILAIVMMVALLFWENRRMFWRIAPVLGVLGVIYLAAFWNSTGTIGAPAQAVRSVFGQASERDEASNLYRLIENYNIMFTIKSTPILGLGFGQKFYMPVEMPDISFFEWWEYITHNSIMWVWMQLGAGGFIAMVFLVATALLTGGRAVRNVQHPTLRVAALTSVLYVAMHFTYAYVDMSWDTNSMVLVGTMMALINSLEAINAKPDPYEPKRWPWLPDRDAPPRLRWPWQEASKPQR